MSKPRIQVKLSVEEERTLWELENADSVSRRIRERARTIRLSNEEWYVERIAAHLHRGKETVRRTLKRWQREGLGGLWEKGGRGRKPKCGEAEMEYLESCIREDERSYNSVQLARKLEEERGVKLHPEYLRQKLKKRG
jgi:transposase